jgi:predicted permease
MRGLTAIVEGLRALFQKTRVEQDLDEELRAYLDASVDRKVAAGMSREDAIRAARVEMGSAEAVKDHVRDAGWESHVESLWQDLRYAMRGMRRAPTFSIVVIGTLALGIGATTTIFSAVDNLLLRPLPYPQPDQLVWIWGQVKGGPQRASVNPLEYRDYREQSTTFSHLGAVANFAQTATLTGRTEPEALRLAVVSGNYFDVLGVRPLLGRPLILDDEEAGRTDVAVISFGLWNRRFGADQRLVGSAVTLDERPVRIVGVMPADFRPPQPADIWMPIAFSQLNGNRRAHFLRPIGRLKDGVTLGQAQAELDVIAGRLEQQYPATSTGWSVRLEPIDRPLIGNLRTQIWVLFGAVSCFLFMACANVAGLLQARATSRTVEIAVRSAIGAARRRIVRQLLTESLLLAVVGSALGLVLAYWALKGLLAVDTLLIPAWASVTMDGRVLAFALLLAVLTTLLFGLIPAWEASRANLADSLKAGARLAGGDRRHTRIRSALVVVQITATVILLVGAGLLMKSLISLQQVDPGFASTEILAVTVALPPARYPQPQQISGFFEELQQRLRVIPGVAAVGMTSHLPLSGQMNDVPFQVEGRGVSEDDRVTVDFRGVNHDYLRAMSIPLIRGRTLTEDEARRAAPVALISQHLAERFFAGQDPLGQRVRAGTFVAEIVGVVGDVRHRSLTSAVFPTMYMPSLARLSTNLVIRTAGSPADFAPAVQAAIRSLDKNLALPSLQPLDQMVDASIARRRLNSVLLSGFAVLALVVALAGIYGVISYSVNERAREIGIRLALGATRGSIQTMVLGIGVKLAAAGTVLGVAGALALSQVISGLLFGVRPTDPATYATIGTLLTATVIVACWLPARRASRIAPLTVTGSN